MLEQVQFACQHANPFVIKALTQVHGVYMNVYNKSEGNLYDEGRDDYISNPSYFNEEPIYSKIKLLLNRPVQETFDSGETSFDSYMEDLFILTCDKTLVFDKKQKFEVFYRKTDKEPVRVFQSFEVKELSNAFNQWSIRKILLEPYN